MPAVRAAVREGFNLEPKDEAALTEEIDEYIHGLRRWVRTAGIDLKQLGGQVADPSGPFDPIISLLSGATSIPQRILIGSERGELASSQDQENWVSHIEERQRQFAEPGVLRALVDRLTWLGALPAPEGGYQVEWPSLFTKSDEDRANIAMRLATAVQRYAQASGQSVDDIMSIEEFRERALGLPKNLP